MLRIYGEIMANSNIYMSIDHYSNTANAWQHTNDMYVNAFKLLNSARSASYVQLIAYSTGVAGGANVGGTNHYDQPRFTGDGAFSVWKFPSGSISGSTSERNVDFYILLQHAGTTSYGSTPGNPLAIGAASPTNVVGIQLAWMANGTSPWNGTTNANGADTKGSSVWASGSHVLPRSNNAGGTHAANKQNCAYFASAAGGVVGGSRYSFYVMRDSIISVFTPAGAGSGYNVLYAGVYKPLQAFTSSHTLPFAMFGYTGTVSGQTLTADNTTIGATAGNSTYEGGVYPRVNVGNDCPKVGLTAMMSTTVLGTLAQQPNMQHGSGSTRYDIWPVGLCINEAPTYGYCGTVEFTSHSYGVALFSNNLDWSDRHAFFGTTSANSSRVCVPWSGSAPGTVGTRAGLQFTRTP